MATTFDSEPRHAPPTRVRYIVVAVATLMSVLLYLDRFCLSFAADYIREDLRLSQTKIAWLLSAFSWSYALAQVPSGWLSDRFGPRLMLVIYIVSWSFFTAMTGISYTFLMLVLMRFGIGAAQAGAYPSCGTLLSQWVPLTARASASSFVAFGGRVGGFLAPMLTAVLIVFFVPSDAELEFTPDQLLDAVSLSRKLSKAGAEEATSVGSNTSSRDDSAKSSSPAALVWSKSTGDVRDAVRSLADRDATAEKQWEAEHPDKTKRPPRPPIEPTTAELEALARGMTALISHEDFYSATAFANVSLNKEGEGTLKRVLANQPVPVETRKRLHRFLLESSFPSELGKLYTRGWRPVMIIYGIAGVFVASIFWFYFRDTPAEHPGCNAAEQTLISAGRAPPAASSGASEAAPVAAKEPFPLGAILTNFSMWCMCVLQFGTNVGWFFLVSWLPRYYYEVHHVPALTRGVLAGIPIFVGMIGLLFGGVFTDLLTRRIGLRWGRKLPMVATRFIGALGYGLALLFASMPADSPFQSPWAFAAAFSLVTLGVDMGIAPTWAFMQDVGGKNVGAILGWGNMWGNFGAALAPLFYNRILGEKPTLSDWNHIFLFCLGACVVSGLGALGVDATKPLSVEAKN